MSRKRVDLVKWVTRELIEQRQKALEAHARVELVTQLANAIGSAVGDVPAALSGALGASRRQEARDAAAKLGFPPIVVVMLEAGQ